jgi:hypothetical protein
MTREISDIEHKFNSDNARAVSFIVMVNYKRKDYQFNDVDLVEAAFRVWALSEGDAATRMVNYLSQYGNVWGTNIEHVQLEN